LRLRIFERSDEIGKDDQNIFILVLITNYYSVTTTKILIKEKALNGSKGRHSIETLNYIGEDLKNSTRNDKVKMNASGSHL
jgi:hypothetical protein